MSLVDADAGRRGLAVNTSRFRGASPRLVRGPLVLALSGILAVASAGCASIEDGARIDVDFEFEGRGASRTDRGYEVLIDWGRLTVSEVEVVPCKPTVVATILRDLWPIRTAHAHT